MIVKPTPLHADHVLALVEGRHPDPHSDLGHHVQDGGVTYRVIRPLATAVTVERADGVAVVLEHHSDGLWHGWVTGSPAAYVVRSKYKASPDFVAEDPYRFGPTLGEQDLYLWGEGRHEQIWKVLGSHVVHHEGVDGVAFSVWAPRAQAVRVVGDFNNWNGPTSAMRRIGTNGLWEIFLPGVTANNAYKFEIRTAAGEWATRADPFAQYTEVPPSTASKTVESSFDWTDDGWMTARANSNPHNGPMSVYEMHLGSWRPGHGYREIAEQLIGYISALGYTHVEFMPLSEHP
ncbi:MAG: glycogen branching protein, partial [Actinomycetota bacterium]